MTALQLQKPSGYSKIQGLQIVYNEYHIDEHQRKTQNLLHYLEIHNPLRVLDPGGKSRGFK